MAEPGGSEKSKPKRRKGLKANYGGASPEQVARALLRHCPRKKTAQEAAK